MNIPAVIERKTKKSELAPLPAYKPARFGKKPRVLVAGASGLLGRYILQILLEKGYTVKALTRNPKAEICSRFPQVSWLQADITQLGTLQKPLEGIDVVISCAGASLSTSISIRQGFDEIDMQGNKNLLSAALYNDVSQFVYVSTFIPRGMRPTRYVEMHEAFVDLLLEARIAYSIIRPTGFFGSFLPVFELAKTGKGMCIGLGKKKSNPVHESDVAQACVEAMEKNIAVLEVGGPDVFSRKEMVQLALTANQKKAFIWPIPSFLFRTAIRPLKWVNRRLYDVFDFVGAISTCDAVAQPYGKLKLKDYFEELKEKG